MVVVAVVSREDFWLWLSVVGGLLVFLVYRVGSRWWLAYQVTLRPFRMDLPPDEPLPDLRRPERTPEIQAKHNEP